MSARGVIKLYPKGRANPHSTPLARIVVTHDGQGRKLRSKKQALARARSLARRVMKNVEAGFYDSTGFHPIRSSRDYSKARAGETQHGKGAVRAATKRARKRRTSIS